VRGGASGTGSGSSVLESVGLLILRVGAGGLLFAGHGLDKLLSLGARAALFPDPLGVGPHVSMALATFAEGVCSLLVVLGVATRLSALPPLITMLVAAFVVHGGDPWMKKELALTYAVPFLALVFTGGGSLSLDSLLRTGRRRQKVAVP
jgi:putative oxidoreductase